MGPGPATSLWGHILGSKALPLPPGPLVPTRRAGVSPAGPCVASEVGTRNPLLGSHGFPFPTPPPFNLHDALCLLVPPHTYPAFYSLQRVLPAFTQAPRKVSASLSPSLRPNDTCQRGRRTPPNLTPVLAYAGFCHVSTTRSPQSSTGMTLTMLDRGQANQQGSCRRESGSTRNQQTGAGRRMKGLGAGVNLGRHQGIVFPLNLKPILIKTQEATPLVA